MKIVVIVINLTDNDFLMKTLGVLSAVVYVIGNYHRAFKNNNKYFLLKSIYILWFIYCTIVLLFLVSVKKVSF